MSHSDKGNMSSPSTDQDPNQPNSSRNSDRAPLRNPELDPAAHLWM